MSIEMLLTASHAVNNIAYDRRRRRFPQTVGGVKERSAEEKWGEENDVSHDSPEGNGVIRRRSSYRER